MRSTWKHLAAGLALVALSVTGGCDCGKQTNTCTRPTVTITSPKDGATLSAADDTNASLAGVQVTVKATTDSCVQNDSTATLVVNDDTNLARSAFVTAGKVSFQNVTLVPADAAGDLTITVSIRDKGTGLVAKSTVNLVLQTSGGPVCKFTTPTDGQTLGASDDADPNTPGFQHDVTLTCDSDLTGTPANLTMDGAPVPSAIFAGKTATFSKVTFSEGANVLSASVATASGTWNGKADVTVNTPACEIHLSPSGAKVFNLDGDPPRLPGRTAIADADPGTPGIQAAFTATTPDCSPGEPDLYVGGKLVTKGAYDPSDATKITFPNVDLPDGNDVQVWIEVAEPGGGSGPTGRSVTQSFVVSSARPAPVVTFPSQDGVLGPADDKDGDPSNGIQADLLVEAPGLVANTSKTAGDGSLIEATLTEVATGTQTSLTCLVGVDHCVDPTNPNVYHLPMNLATDGAWRVTVKVTGPAGNVGTTGPVDFSSSTNAVAVAIDSPAAGASVSLATAGVTGTTVPVHVTAQGLPSGAPVTVLCTGATAPAQGTLDATGSATIPVDFGSAPCDGVATSCTASVSAGGSNLKSAAVAFHVDLTAPTLAIVAPADGATVYDTSVSVEVVSQCLEDGQTITVTSDGGATGSAKASGNAAVVPMTLQSGTHVLTAAAADKAGNPATSSPVSVTVDATPPTVVFTAPTDGVVLNAADDADPAKPGFQHDVTVQVANEPAGTEVALQVGYDDGGQTVWRAPLGPVATAGTGLKATFPAVDLPEGALRLQAVATGASGLKGQKNIALTVSTGLPTCNIVAPTDGASLGLPADANANPADGIQTDVRVRTSAADGKTVSLTLVDGTGTSHTFTGTVSGGEAVFPSMSFTTASGSQNGSNTLDAVCDAGSAKPGHALTNHVDVDLEPPAATLVTPVDGTVFNAASLDQSADPGFQVQVVATATDPSTGKSVKVGAMGTLTVTCGGQAQAPQTTTFDTWQGQIQARFKATLVDQQSCTLSFVATDLAGNKSTPATATVAVDRVPPTVAISAPADGTLFGKVDDASAGTPGFQHDVTVTYSGVESGQPVHLFFSRLSAGGTPVEASGSPHLVGAGSMTGYTFPAVTYTPQTDDQVTIQVTVTDAAGNTASASVGVTVDMTAPQVAITRPKNGDPCINVFKDFDFSKPGIQTQVNVDTSGIANGLPLTLCSSTGTGTACGTSGFFQVAQSTVSGNTVYFQSIDLTEGNQQLEAESADQAGNTAASAPVTVCADSIPPVVTALTVPADTNGDGAINAAELQAAGGQVCFDAKVTGADGRTLTIYTNNPAANTVVGTGTVTGGQVQVCGSLPEGGQQITAFVTDVNGNPNLNASNPTITDPQAVIPLVKDTVPPTLTVTAPTGTVLNGSTDGNPSTPAWDGAFTVSSDAPGQTVTFTVDGAAAGTAVVTSGTASVNVSLSNNASHTLAAAVTDAAGNQTTISQTVQVDTTPPTVAITSPTGGSFVNTNQVQVTVNVTGAAAGNPLTIERTDTSTQLASTTVSATQPQTVTVNIADGTPTLVATAQDSAGNVGTSSPVSFTVKTTGCSIVFVTPATATVTWNASDDADPATPGLQTTLVAETSTCQGRTITLLKNGTQVAATTSSAGTGQASFPVTLNDGETGTFTAQMTDQANNVTSSSFTFSVDITAPTLAWTAPTAAKLAYVTSTNATVGTVVNGYLRIADTGAAAGAQAPFSFDATGANGGTLVITLGASTLYSASITADPQTLTPTVTIPQNAAGTLTATLTDAAGNTATVTRDVLVDVVAPAAPTVTTSLTNDRTATVGVTWTAVGDDGASTGTPAGYEVRWATSPITDDATFSTATLATTAAPTATSFTLTPLPPLNTYSIAVRAKDELDNMSPVTVGTDVASQANTWTEQLLAGEGGYYGFSMAAHGADLNHDGYDDLVVGAYQYSVTNPSSGTGANRGAIYIYYGGPNPANLTVQKIVGQTDGENFGYRIDTGDVNGDGIPDLIVSGAGYNSGQGRVFIYFGVDSTKGVTQVDPASAIELRGTNATTAQFGRSFSVVGDLNGDGTRDLAVSARLEGPNKEGKVYIFYGRPTATWQSDASAKGYLDTTDANLSFIGTTTDGDFGYRFGFADLGDFDGDGKDDLAIPQLYTNAGTPDASIYVFRSSDFLTATQPVPASAAYQHIVPGGVSYIGTDGFGFSPDGTSRYLVETDIRGTTPQTRLYPVTPTGVTMPAPESLAAPASTLNFGWSATWGDLNGDGKPDLVIGSNGSATNSIYLYFNKGQSPFFSSTGPDTTLQRTGFFGTGVWVGDINGDGKEDVAGGAFNDNGGLGYVHLWY